MDQTCYCIFFIVLLRSQLTQHASQKLPYATLIVELIVWVLLCDFVCSFSILCPNAQFDKHCDSTSKLWKTLADLLSIHYISSYYAHICQIEQLP